MKLLKDKKLYMGVVMTLVVACFLTLVFAQTFKPTPKEMPLAFVVEDKGVAIPNQGTMNMGQVMSQTFANAASGQTEVSPVKWTVFSGMDEAMSSLNNREQYALIIFPGDFTMKQMSLQSSNPASPEIKVVLNQGMNALAISAVTTMTDQMIATMNQTVREQIFTSLSQTGNSLTTEQARLYVNPITKTVEYANPTGVPTKIAGAPALLTNIMWISCIALAVLVFIILRKLTYENRKEKIGTLSLSVLVGLVFSFVVGFTAAYLTKAMGLDLPDPAGTAIVMSLGFFCFFLLMVALLSWVGIGGAVLFPATMFIGMSALQLPYEFAPSFTQHWIHPWLPQRFLVEGLQEYLFFDKGVFNNNMTVLFIVGAVSLVVFTASAFKPSKKVSIEE